MIIGFDIGNTNIVGAVYNKTGDILCKFRIATEKKFTEHNYFSTIKPILDINNIDFSLIKNVIMSSVVTELDNVFELMCKIYFKTEIIKITPLMGSLPLRYSMPNAELIGADRVVNMVESLVKYKYNEIITIDMGTATTFEVLINSTYIGGAIIPGITSMFEALSLKTSKLPYVKLHKPNKAAGITTKEQINSGIFWGYVGQIKEIIKQLKSSAPNAYVIATGGLASIVSEEIEEINFTDKDMTLNGLFTIFNIYTNNKK